MLTSDVGLDSDQVLQLQDADSGQGASTGAQARTVNCKE